MTEPINQVQNQETEIIRIMKPPDMNADPSQFSLFEKRLKHWSKFLSLSIPKTNPLYEKPKQAIGDLLLHKEREFKST